MVYVQGCIFVLRVLLQFLVVGRILVGMKVGQIIDINSNFCGSKGVLFNMVYIGGFMYILVNLS